MTQATVPDTEAIESDDDQVSYSVGPKASIASVFNPSQIGGLAGNRVINGDRAKQEPGRKTGGFVESDSENDSASDSEMSESDRNVGGGRGPVQAEAGARTSRRRG